MPPIDQLPRALSEAVPEALPEAAPEAAPETQADARPGAAVPAGPRQTLAMRLAARNGQRELRAARLARLRAGPGAAPADPARPAAGPEPAATFLEIYLRGLPLAPDGAPDLQPESAAKSTTESTAGAVLPFLGTSLEAATDLGRLPGAGPGLVQALRRAGLHRLADVARLEPAALAARLGPIGRLVPARAWIAAARAEAAGDPVPLRPEAAGTAR